MIIGLPGCLSRPVFDLTLKRTGYSRFQGERCRVIDMITVCKIEKTSRSTDKGTEFRSAEEKRNWENPNRKECSLLLLLITT